MTTHRVVRSLKFFCFFPFGFFFSCSFLSFKVKDEIFKWSVGAALTVWVWGTFVRQPRWITWWGRTQGMAKTEGPRPTMMDDNLVFCAGANTQVKHTRGFKRNDIYFTRKKKYKKYKKKYKKVPYSLVSIFQQSETEDSSSCLLWFWIVTLHSQNGVDSKIILWVRLTHFPRGYTKLI